MFKIPYECKNPEKCKQLASIEWNEHQLPVCNLYKKVLNGKIVCKQGEKQK